MTLLTKVSYFRSRRSMNLVKPSSGATGTSATLPSLSARPEFKDFVLPNVWEVKHCHKSCKTLTISFLSIDFLYFEMERYANPRATHMRRSGQCKAYAENQINIRKGLQTKLQQCTILQILENGKRMRTKTLPIATRPYFLSPLSLINKK